VAVPTEAGVRVARVRNGRGLVATRRFSAGEDVLEVRGEVVPAAALARWWRVGQGRRATNCYRYSPERYLDPGDGAGAYANHSCRPNAGVVRYGRALHLKAILPIACGDEVTHDYSTLLGVDDVWTMRCNCGERCCRGLVSNVATIPSGRLGRYVAHRVVPDFILKALR
jgi:hypothetical protein